MAKDKTRLDVALVERGFAETRAAAQRLVMAGLVFSGEKRLDKAGLGVGADTALEVRGQPHPYVSRGGLKLERALEVFGIPVAGRIALDVGSSTGGFTDCLLQQGAAKVYAVDVGTNQLAWKLRQDPRVVSMEKTNIRDVTAAQIPEPVDLIVCDASFIGLRTALPAALALASKLPKPINDCGQSFFDRRTESTEHLAIGRLDYTWNSNHSMFGRYQLARLTSKPDNDPANVLAYANGPINDMVHSFVFGDTYLLGANTVNSFRATYNKSDIRKDYVPFFDAKSLGVRNINTPLPGFTAFNVSGGFTLGPTGAKPSAIQTTSFQIIDDVSLVRGAHQIGFGVNYIRAGLQSTSYGSAAGSFAFTGVNTGLGLSDFLLGRPASFTQGQVYGPGGVMPYLGSYIQDAWKVSSNITLNVGLRWDPFFPYSSDQRHFNHFSLEQFNAGVRSTVYRNAPIGVIFEGDPGYPGNAAGKRQLADLAPRLSGVWDPTGNGRMTVRAAYGRFYDLPHIWSFLGFDRGTPFGTELVTTNGTFDDPWVNTLGGNPFPIVARPDMTFPQYGGFVTFPLDMKPPYFNQWNLSVQRQLGQEQFTSLVRYAYDRGILAKRGIDY